MSAESDARAAVAAAKAKVDASLATHSAAHETYIADLAALQRAAAQIPTK